MPFPFTMIVEYPETGTFERVTGTEPGRARIGERAPTVPAVQVEAHRPERAIWGCDHGRHGRLSSPRFATGGVWYDSLGAWATAWRATILERVPCDRFGNPVEARRPVGRELAANYRYAVQRIRRGTTSRLALAVWRRDQLNTETP